MFFLRRHTVVCIDAFQYTKKYCIWIKKKAKYCYLTFSKIFHFSAIIFHVDSCESYATLDQDERQKSGDSLYDDYSILNRAKKVL